MTLYADGSYDIKQRYIAPTVIKNVTPLHPVMQEIFGPILPVLSVNSIDEAIQFARCRDKPLALYVFAKDKGVISKVLSSTSSGGVSVNDTIMHIACPELPFGGVGPSGMGAYNARYTFETFSHRKAVLEKGTWVDPAVRYPPYTESKKATFRRLNDFTLPPLPTMRQLLLAAAGVVLIRSRL